MCSSRLSSFFILLLFLQLSSAATAQTDTATVQGQEQVNILRHTVAVENLPSQFARQGHILLSRSVVPLKNIWETIDDFTRDTLSRPEILDWYVADYSTDGRRTITINAAFSCLDVGQSTARPLTWWASRGFAELKNKSREVGGANVAISSGESSVNDITAQCLAGRRPISDENFRLVEHRHQHRGIGVLFTKKPLPRSVVGNYRVFAQLEKERLAADDSNEVIYHDSGLPVTRGLTFDSGVRVWVPKNFRTDRTLDLRVPITPQSAVTKHSGARLEEARVAEGQTSTTISILVFTVLSAGLPLLLAIWWVAKHVADTKVHHSLQSQELPIYEAIERASGWTVQEKVLLIMNLFAVSILVAPFALAVAEGKINPKISVEVTTGATVLYGTTQPELSEDPNNPVAGAPFVVTVWMSVRHLGYGFVLALTGSLLLIAFLAIAIVLWVSKRSNELMPGSKSRFKGFSLWKLYGSLRLYLQSLQNGEVTRYRVLLELYDDAIDELGAADVEGKKKELLLMHSYDMRERANTRFFLNRTQRKDQQIKRLAREALAKEFRKFSRCGRARYRLLSKVLLDNVARYQAALSQSAVHDKHLPREWEYVRRSRRCEGIDWYRTNGIMPPDDALIFARLGMLPYMKYIKKVVIKQDHGQDTGEYDEDGVKTVLIVTPLESGFNDVQLHGDVPESQFLKDRNDVPNMLTRHMSAEMEEVPWGLGTNSETVNYGGGILHVPYIVMREEEATLLCSSGCGV